MVVAGADVVILLSEERAGDAVSNTVVVLDAATGRQLWSRAQVLFEGINADVVIVEDEHDGRPARFTDDPDPASTSSARSRSGGFSGSRRGPAPPPGTSPSRRATTSPWDGRARTGRRSPAWTC